MAKDKKSFLMYCDWMELFEELPDELAGQLIKHIFKYVNDLNPETDNLILKTSFSLIRQQFKRDLVKYEQLCSKNSSNARKRWDAVASDGMRNHAKHADTVIVTDTVTDTDIKKRTATFEKKVRDTSQEKGYAQKEVDKFINFWGQINEGGNKMHWEKLKTFQISRRLVTWMGNAKEWKSNDKTDFPTEPNLQWYNGCTDDKLRMKAIQNWKSNGWIKVENKKGDITGWRQV